MPKNTPKNARLLPKVLAEILSLVVVKKIADTLPPKISLLQYNTKKTQHEAQTTKIAYLCQIIPIYHV